MSAEGFDWAVVPTVAGATWAAAYGFFMKWFVPQRIASIERERDMWKEHAQENKDKANKYDALNEKLAQGALARLDG